MKKEKKQLRRLLIVEDDPGLQSQLRWAFDGYDVAVAGDRQSAMALVGRFKPPVVTLDLGLPPDPADTSEGLALLEEILGTAPETKVIVVTGNDDRENAVASIALGAYDFYQKPVDPDLLGLIVNRAYKLYELETENRKLARRSEHSPLEGIIAASPAMLEICRKVERVAPTDITVLILGESGTGKEILARALHDLNPRNQGPFVAINCAAIPENLLESELFGYEKGAFTGAARQTKGKIEFADRGTLFLDEVGDLPQALQPKLLRFLQERVVERVGGREAIPVDVRVVAATHQDLTELMAEGILREDLYYRISEISLQIPALRERNGDSVLIARTLLKRFGRQFGRSIRGFSDDAIAAMERYAWPGNVRERENRVKRAVIMADGARITAEDLELEAPPEQRVPLSIRQAREEAERRATMRALGLSGGNVSQAAQILSVSRPTLYDLMKKYHLK